MWTKRNVNKLSVLYLYLLLIMYLKANKTISLSGPQMFHITHMTKESGKAKSVEGKVTFCYHDVLYAHLNTKLNIRKIISTQYCS